MRGVLPNDWKGIPLFETARAAIKRVDTVLDVGPGIRPQRLVECKRHLCVDAHFEYCEVLAKGGFEVLHGSAPYCLRNYHKHDLQVDTVVMLDVIEHMTRTEGQASIAAALDIAHQQVVVFTPLGFLPQAAREDGRDAWGMNGQAWQEHRSGWKPEDFPRWQGWKTIVDEHFAPGHAAFIAIWDRQ